jgi:hypothetical protein
MQAGAASCSSSAREGPSEKAAPWYMSLEDIEESPSRQYFVQKYGSVEKARIREQECRLSTCAFLQESGQKLRLYVTLPPSCMACPILA